MSDLKNVVSENFSRYAGNVILDRAICDVRDMLKPSARMLTYSQLHITKNIPSKPHVKSARVVGDALGHYYTHGDGACYATYMRMAKPFAMRYPLEDCQGNSGTITATGDEAASRYTELRLSKIGSLLFSDIDKNTILDWNDNFDETDTYPKVLPSKGFYNIVNGSTGIGVSLSASIPQFNLTEINNAMCHLIDDPNYEISILPDFATGAILINPDQVLESLKTGSGFACKLRSVIEFDPKLRAFQVKELPYGVYTNTISEEIQKLVETQPDCGIDHINDGSGKQPDYYIYLTKKANPDKVLKLLYKETSLQSYFTINMTTLVDNGRRPQVMGLKEMLQAHIDHEKEVYRRGFEFDLKKIESRIHIIDGLLICLARIEEVVQTIKSSASTAAAMSALCKNFLLDEIQAKAVLDMKLSRLAHLEVKKLEDERESLLKESDRIHKILDNEVLFNQELKNGWTEVARVFGDARRTKVITLATGDDTEPIEQKRVSVTIYSDATLVAQESNTLYSQKRNGVGTKFKLGKGEFAVDTLTGQNTDTILFFTSRGNFYSKKMSDIPLEEKVYLSETVHNEHIVAAALLDSSNKKKYVIFVTKNGILKKSELSEYNLSRNTGAIAIKLDSGDEIVSVIFVDDERIGISTVGGQFIIISTKDIRSIGRTARGIIGIKLNEKDQVCCAQSINSDTREIVSISTDGFIKRSSIGEFKLTGRATKGVKIQNTDSLCGILPISTPSDLLVTSTNAQIRININDVPLLGRGAQGVKALKMSENSKIVNISAF